MPVSRDVCIHLHRLADHKPGIHAFFQPVFVDAAVMVKVLGGLGPGHIEAPVELQDPAFCIVGRLSYIRGQVHGGLPKIAHIAQISRRILRVVALNLRPCAGIRLSPTLYVDMVCSNHGFCRTSAVLDVGRCCTACECKKSINRAGSWARLHNAKS